MSQQLQTNLHLEPHQQQISGDAAGMIDTFRLGVDINLCERMLALCLDCCQESTKPKAHSHVIRHVWQYQTPFLPLLQPISGFNDHTGG
jgi:hypothetical protein